MKSKMRIASLAFLASFAAGAASAETSSIQYLVQRKPLVQGTNAASNLTFRFYSDDQCATETGNVAMAAGNAAISFERVKGQRLGRLKGADYVRIDALLPDVPADATFVKVEGAGVVPAKSPCQPQTLASTSLRVVDVALVNELLSIAGVEDVDALLAALQAGELPTGVVCELLATLLGEAGTDVSDLVCGVVSTPGDPTDLLGQLLGGLSLNP
jgi:hypothetical protein